jgi:hypothetical protein
MKRSLSVVAAAAAVFAFSQMPANAAPVKSKIANKTVQTSQVSDDISSVRKHRRIHRHIVVTQPTWYGWEAPIAMRGPVVSDPSFGYFPSYWRAKASGRCVVDLGYGRYEYCGW